MSPLRVALDQYLSLRRSLGFILRVPEVILRKFVAFAENEGVAFITIDLILNWAKQPSRAHGLEKSLRTRAQR